MTPKKHTTKQYAWYILATIGLFTFLFLMVGGLYALLQTNPTAFYALGAFILTVAFVSCFAIK